jgi:uncharacterized membrane protein HdeD (DUF308 family)
MLGIFNRWWMWDLRGTTSFALAALLLLGPDWGSSLVVAMAFGVYALIDGIGTLAFIRGARGVDRRAYVGRGALGIATGALILAHPSASLLSLYLVMATWGVGTGVLEILFGSRTWSTIPKSLGFMLIGTLSLGLGVTLFHFTLESAATLRAFLAVYAVANGIASTTMGEALHAVPGTTRTR